MTVVIIIWNLEIFNSILLSDRDSTNIPKLSIAKLKPRCQVEIKVFISKIQIPN